MLAVLFHLTLIKHAIFDVDGTILDTEGIFERAVTHITQRHFTPELKEKISNKTKLELGKGIMEYYNISGSPVEFMRQLDDLHAKMMENVPFMPGAEDLINKLYDMNVKLGIATNAPRFLIEAKLFKHPDIFSKFSVLSTRSDIKNKKPDPEIYHLTMKRFNTTDPSEFLVFEDTVKGVKAAMTAGMKCILIPYKNYKYQEELEKFGVTPTKIINSFNEFNVEDFEFQ